MITVILYAFGALVSLASLWLDAYAIVCITSMMTSFEVTMMEGACVTLLAKMLTHQAVPRPEKGGDEYSRFAIDVLKRLFVVPIVAIGLAYIFTFFF